MGTQKSRGALPLKGFLPDDILNQWLEAAKAIFLNYSTLSDRLSDCHKRAEQGTTPSEYIGQCSIDQATSLLCTMHREMQKLLLDMDQSVGAGRPTNSHYYRKLQSHAAKLDRLNQQAQVLIQLMALPSC